MSYLPYYSITNSILKNVSSSEASKQIIENALLVPQWERKFKASALARTIHHSIAIEGNALSLAETENIIAGKELLTIRNRDVFEIINYREAINLLNTKVNELLSFKLLFDLHIVLGTKILSAENLGVLRESESVLINSKSGEVVFEPTEPYDIRSELSELFRWDKREGALIHPLLRAGIIHYELVRIHPFVDLNGRTSRLIATWSLLRDGYDIRKFFSLEEFYDQDTLKYYDALNSAHTGDLTMWLDYFTYGVAIEFERVKKEVLEMSRDRRLIQKMGQLALNERQIKIVRYLEANDKFENKDFGLLFPTISDDTILRDLKDLQKKNLITKKGKTKASKYILV